jgi:hypothetical protein
MSATLAAGRPVGRLLAEMRRWTPCPLKKMAEPPFSATQALRAEWLFLPLKRHLHREPAASSLGWTTVVRRRSIHQEVDQLD